MEDRHWVLNKDITRQIITEQDLKHWWLAEQSGIHRTTLRRWLDGRIVRVKDANLRNLASVLNVPQDFIAQRCA